MSKKGKIISYSLVTIICWASAFPLSKYVLLHGLSTQSLSIARLVIGGILLAGIIAYKKMPLPVGRDWIYLFLLPYRETLSISYFLTQASLLFPPLQLLSLSP